MEEGEYEIVGGRKESERVGGRKRIGENGRKGKRESGRKEKNRREWEEGKE